MIMSNFYIFYELNFIMLSCGSVISNIIMYSDVQSAGQKNNFLHQQLYIGRIYLFIQCLNMIITKIKKAQGPGIRHKALHRIS